MGGSIANSLSAEIVVMQMQYTCLTDAGAPRRLNANQQEVMAKLPEVLYVFKHKRKQFILTNAWQSSNIPPVS